MSTGTEQLQLGFNRLELSHAQWLSQARTHAKHLSATQTGGRVTSDDLRRAADQGLIQHPHHRNAWGAVFREGIKKSGFWKRMGTTSSTLPSNHDRKIGVWVWCVPDGQYIVEVT